jgi:hypothetical protein
VTEPGYVAPAAPGWWVRTNRVGTTKTGYNWDTKVVGGRASRGRASGSYGWSGSASGHAPKAQFVGATIVEGNIITLPPHQVGDLLIICAYVASSTVSPTTPGSVGAIPVWVDIDASSGSDANVMHTAAAVATRPDHTSGNWGIAEFMIAVVVRGQGATPIGGHAEAGTTGTGFAIAPAITMTHADDSSLLLEFYGHRRVSSWDPAPPGYTRQCEIVDTSGMCLNTKDNTASDGAITQTASTSTGFGYRGATVEVRFY